MDTRELISQMIDNIVDGDNLAAKDSFNTAINQKLELALDTEKQNIASSLYANNRAEDGTEQSEEIQDETAV